MLKGLAMSPRFARHVFVSCLSGSDSQEWTRLHVVAVLSMLALKAAHVDQQHMDLAFLCFDH